MRRLPLALALSALLPFVALAQAEPAAKGTKYRSAKEIIDAAPASAWRTLDPANTLYMELPAGRVVIATVAASHPPPGHRPPGPATRAPSPHRP